MTVHFTDRPDPARADADAIRKAWESREWPHPGLLSYSVHAGEDGTTLLHYSQWTGEQAHQDFVRQGPDARDAGIDAAVPGIESLAPHTYELYRSGFRAEGDTREPGCVVIVEAEFAGPDPARQRDWVDTVFEALGEDPHTPADGIAAPGEGVGSPSPLWERVQKYPGMTGGGVNRYTPALSMKAG
ncbi:antibiotic biosynthesis monooxygenase [Streptomyces microflavus]